METPTLKDVMEKVAQWPNRRDALLDQNEAPIYCSIAKDHMATLRYAGGGPRFLKPTARTVLYRVGDLDDWLDASACTTTADRGTK